MRRIAAALTLVVAVMPFHAFLSVWLGSLVGHEAVIQSWKEVLILVLGVAAAVLAFREPKRLAVLKQPVVYLGGAFILVASLVTLVAWPQASGIAYGAKTDLEFIVAFILALFVAASLRLERLVKLTVGAGLVTAVIGLGLVTVLPHNLLSHFGYNVSTITPFERVDPAISAIRTPSTLGGPNQFGAYLIIPLCLALVIAVKRRNWRYGLGALIMLGGIFVSYSRAALIGAVVGGIIAVVASLPRRHALRVAAAGGLTLIIVFAGLLSLTDTASKLGYYVLHQNPHGANTTASTSQHVAAFKRGLDEIKATPLGRGLGTAGPASYHTAHPFVPESYYLQIGIETGVVGLVLFFAFLAQTLFELLRRRYSDEAAGLVGALVGLCIVSLVLHGWADSSSALIFWILAGAAIGVRSGNALDPVPTITLLGVKLSNVTFAEALDRIEAMIERRQPGLVATIGAEFIVRAQKDLRFRSVLNAATLAVADGSGPTIITRLLGNPLRARVPGVDLCERLMERAAANGWRVFLLGGQNGVAADTQTIWEAHYPGLIIAGIAEPARTDSSRTLIDAVAATHPDIILVAFGAPYQEFWITDHLEATGAAVGIGVGGTFDFVAGRSRRAPKLMRRLGLEWLYRLSQEPRRIKRMMAVPLLTFYGLIYRSRPTRKS